MASMTVELTLTASGADQGDRGSDRFEWTVGSLREI